ncbi:MAG: transcriptional regulator NrdR [candidate division NC10 bacterium]|nr:transcriptional repressor NrdR [candidate division NC10 bacterium]MCH7896188.1 transcriptional repressor NrdR [candidate division NC10 bacterium]MCZ6550813.1 transcriptional regulator NrdR [candidate division NC10 bacterium]
MKCPFCGQIEEKVVDSREARDGAAVRRRRECLNCGRRFTTYERIEEIQFMVVKKDGRREPFDRNKILSGLVKATQKRPVGVAELDKITDEVETRLTEKPDREISSIEIGELIIQRLYELDEVAYVRFASVYRQFKDVSEFVEEVKGLLETSQRRPRQT